MSLCILSGAKLTTVAASLFTLSWTHSVEKIEWHEKWGLMNSHLKMIEARMQGSGAGMDPPEGSIFSDGWWIYSPKEFKIKELLLSTSNTQIENWKICYNGTCKILKKNQEKPIKIFPCK